MGRVSAQEVGVAVDERPAAERFFDMTEPLHGPLRQVTVAGLEVEHGELAWRKGADRAYEVIRLLDGVSGAGVRVVVMTDDEPRSSGAVAVFDVATIEVVSASAVRGPDDGERATGCLDGVPVDRVLMVGNVDALRTSGDSPGHGWGSRGLCRVQIPAVCRPRLGPHHAISGEPAAALVVDGGALGPGSEDTVIADAEMTLPGDDVGAPGALADRALAGGEVATQSSDLSLSSGLDGDVAMGPVAPDGAD